VVREGSSPGPAQRWARWSQSSDGNRL